MVINSPDVLVGQHAKVEGNPQTDLENEADPPTEESLIEVMVDNPSSSSTIATPVSHDLRVSHEPRTSIRRVKRYTLPDGSTISGKGLGRGRPGIKRGPRRFKTEADDSPAERAISFASILPQPIALTPLSIKRKRTDSSTSVVGVSTGPSTSATSASRDSSVEFIPQASQTRSGRQTQKPTTLLPPPDTPTSPTSKRQKQASTTAASAQAPIPVKSHPKIKRRLYRGKEQFALCEHCLRGHGPVGNVIVFCDACNKCWHQRCHDPHVPKEVVTDAKAQWFCDDCDRILHGQKKHKRQVEKTESTPAPVPLIVQPIVRPPQRVTVSYNGPMTGASAIAPEHRLAYLNYLPKEKLVSLVMQLSDLVPALPIFAAPIFPPAPVVVQVPQAQFTSTYVTPVFETPSFAPSGSVPEIQDEGYDDYFDEHAALYPKPGHGVKLPAESVDMHILLEAADSKTFSHWVRPLI